MLKKQAIAENYNNDLRGLFINKIIVKKTFYQLKFCLATKKFNDYPKSISFECT